MKFSNFSLMTECGFAVRLKSQRLRNKTNNDIKWYSMVSNVDNVKIDTHNSLRSEKLLSSVIIKKNRNKKRTTTLKTPLNYP